MGAAGALARAIALRLAGAGADLALTTATPDPEAAFELRRIAKSVSDRGRRCLVESVDLGLGTSVQITVRQVAKALGGIDLLVVAPDFRLERPTERLSDADWSKLLNLNLSSVFFACRAAAREMFGREPNDAGLRGRIVVLTADVEAVGGSAAYRAAKAGVAALTQGLAAAWAAQGIGVSHVIAADISDEAVAAKTAGLILQLADAPLAATPGEALRVDA